jgi:hypothetical protein
MVRVLVALLRGEGASLRIVKWINQAGAFYFIYVIERQ